MISYDISLFYIMNNQSTKFGKNAFHSLPPKKTARHCIECLAILIPRLESTPFAGNMYMACVVYVRLLHRPHHATTSTYMHRYNNSI